MTTSYLPGPEGEKPLVAYPKKRRNWPWLVAAIFVALLCGFGSLALISTAGDDKPGEVHLPSAETCPVGRNDAACSPMTQPTTAPTTDPTTPPATKDGTLDKPKAVPVTVGEGVWQVGVDVKAGRYRLLTSPGKDDGCYWEIAKDDAGDDIVSNGLPTGGHPQVTLKKGQYFTSQDCGDWTLIN